MLFGCSLRFFSTVPVQRPAYGQKKCQKTHFKVMYDRSGKISKKSQKYRSGSVKLGWSLRHDRDRLIERAFETQSIVPVKSSCVIRIRYRSGRSTRTRLWKRSHGVETYKFFQNWLRVPFYRFLGAYIEYRANKTLMGRNLGPGSNFTLDSRI